MSKDLLLDVRNYTLGYLANRGPNCQVSFDEDLTLVQHPPRKKEREREREREEAQMMSSYLFVLSDTIPCMTIAQGD